VRLLAAEAALGTIAVALLVARPDLGSIFLPDGTDPALVRTFAAADLVAYVGSPAAAAWGLERDRPWARGALWFHVGAAAYATLWAWGAVVVAGASIAGGLVTALPAALFAALALRLRP
jgi:hypothetical protein